jgi:ribosomal protein L7/L12
MFRVEVVGWKKGFFSISFIRLIREAGVRKLGLAEAKCLVDGMISGSKFALDFESEEAADRFAVAAEELGAVVSRFVPQSGSEVNNLQQ